MYKKYNIDIKQVQDLAEQDRKNKIEARNILDKVISQGNRQELSAYGCVLGAFIGDSIGSFMEFSDKVLAKKLIDKAMGMPGLGYFNVNPGQLTDDSELALSLGDGLIKGKGVYDVSQVAFQYQNWVNSLPFDCGQTMKTSFQTNSFSVFESNQKYSEDLASEMSLRSIDKNMKSQSNGCLMKITPLAIFISNFKCKQDIVNCVQSDVSLTHPDKTVNQACYIWVQSIVDIIQYYEVENDIREIAKKVYQRAKKYVESKGIEELKEWWEDEVEREYFRDATELIGWVRIPWTYTFIFLKQIAEGSLTFENPDELYQNIIRQVLLKGGDTDTNACIIGGVIGCLVGIDKIPQQFINTHINCSVIPKYYEENNEELVNNLSEKRNIKYSPYQSVFMTKKLLEMRKEEIQIKNPPYMYRI